MKPWGTVLRLAFLVAGVVFIALAFAETWGRSRGSVLPGWRHLLLAFVLALVGLTAAGRGWTALLGVEDPALRRGFYLSQLGKYIPGLVWQAVGQVGLTARAGVPVARASATFPIHALTQLAAGSSLGALVAFVATDLALPVRLLALTGLVPLVVLARGWMVRALGLLRRWIPDAAGVVPSQAATARSYAWSVGTMAASGAAFALLAVSADRSIDPLTAVFGYALGWAAGFAAVPVPAGIGVRELVLVVLVGPAAPVLAASIAHRLVTIVAEAVIILASHVRR